MGLAFALRIWIFMTCRSSLFVLAIKRAELICSPAALPAIRPSSLQSQRIAFFFRRCAARVTMRYQNFHHGFPLCPFRAVDCRCDSTVPSVAAPDRSRQVAQAIQ